MADTAPTSVPSRPKRPDIVVIVLDDLGFAQLGCYGSNLDTPNLDRLAAEGLRFTNFHTTAICSPTRACLLTGRNHHRVGMGMLPDLPVNFPGYVGRFSNDAATLAQVLAEQGYATRAIGKWHLVPRDERATGPMSMWPLSKGFERYYGFLNGETNQFTPNLVRDSTHVDPPYGPDEGYHLDIDLADEAIAQIRDLDAHQPDRPLFMWYATAAPHAPHQAPPEWLAKYRGRFDGGWDQWREDVFARQVEMGLIPPATTMSERPDWVPAWDSLTADEQRLYARMMEAFAAMVSHADHHIGRVLDELDRLGRGDDAIVVVVSDNGCSAEGGPHGTHNQLGHYIGDEPDDLERELSHIDDIGGPRSSGHYPWGWALAGNTPFQRWKRYTYEGGVRDPFLLRHRSGANEAGGMRNQFVHAVDLSPTLLELAGLSFPDVVGGVPQMSLDGTSVAPVVRSAKADEIRTVQYFECWGSRAIYADGYKAVTNHVNQLTAAERQAMSGSASFATDRWGLFHVASDPTETSDLAEAEPERLAAMVRLWHSEAQRNGVLPLDDGRDSRLPHLYLPNWQFRDTFRFRPGQVIHEVHGPYLGFGFTARAEFGQPVSASDGGVICEQGDRSMGWSWWLDQGSAVVSFAMISGVHEVRLSFADGVTTLALSAQPGGERATAVEVAGFAADGSALGSASMAVPHALPIAWSPDGAFLTVAHATEFAVTDSYRPPARCSAALQHVSFRIGAPAGPTLDDLFEYTMEHQ